MTILRSLSLATCVGLLLLASPARADEPPDQAETLLREGIALGKANDLPGARDKLRAAFDLKPSYDIAANLGFVEVKLGAWKDAATHLDYARRVFPPSAPPAIKDSIDKFLTEAKGHVGAIQLDTEAEAAVLVDGAKIGLTPLESAVFLDPGPHQIRIEKPGFDPEQVVIDLKVGETRATKIQLKKSAASVPPVTQDERPLWPAFVLGGVAAAGIGVGIGGVVAGLSATSDFDGVPCPAGPETCPQAGRDAVDERNTLIGVGSVGFAVGAASLAAMVIYLAWPEDKADEPRALFIVPSMGPQQWGVGLGGSF
jgi:hypothetical protein